MVALFDPSAATPVVPRPNDLAIDPATGLLQLPDAVGASLAQQDFNAWLRTLDGFPTAAPATITFSGKLDPASVKPLNLGSAAGAMLAIQAQKDAVDWVKP